MEHDAPWRPVQPPRIPDGRRGGLRPDAGRLLPAQGPRRAEELRADRRPRPTRSSTSSCRAASPTRRRSTPSRSPRSSTAASCGRSPTKIDGELFCETLPKTAQIADKITVIRSMTHGEAAHERGTHNMFTGYRPSPALQYPSIGSVVSHEFGPRNNLPPYVCVPSMPNVYAGTGYLSSAFSPFSLGSDPADGGFQVQDLNLPGGIDDSRFATRRQRARRGQRPLRHARRRATAWRRWTRSISGPTA